MSTRVGLIRSLFKTAQLAEPASPRYPGCRNRREDYLVLVQERLQRWHNRRYDPNMWPLIINDKLLGYAFAHSIGVRTPRVLFCSADGLAGLPAKWPAAWGPRFAVKPLYGTNSDGVLLVSSGVDLISGRPVRGRADVQELYLARDWSKLAQIGPAVHRGVGRATSRNFPELGRARHPTSSSSCSVEQWAARTSR